MSSIEIDQSLRELLKRRRLFLRPVAGGGTVLVCLDDGTRDGFEVGRVVAENGPTKWTVYNRRRLPDNTFDMYKSEGLPWEGFEEQIRDVLRLATYADVLRRIELSSGVATTYTADLGEERAEWLAGVPELAGFPELGGITWATAGSDSPSPPSPSSEAPRTPLRSRGLTSLNGTT
ncbi:hypothetical protein ACWD5Q_33995 [Streptomyces sp. NPDC002513]